MRTANTTIQISKKHGTFAVNLLLKHFAKTLDFLDLIYFPILLSLVNIEFHFFNYSCDFLSRPNENIRKPLNTLPHWQKQLLHTNCPLEETAKTNKWPNLKPISKDRLFSLIRAGVLQLKSTAFAFLRGWSTTFLSDSCLYFLMGQDTLNTNTLRIFNRAHLYTKDNCSTNVVHGVWWVLHFVEDH